MQKTEMKIAPWKDYAGNEIKEGDVIRHPSGETGKVVYVAEGGRNGYLWFVNYDNGEPLSLLSLQIGWKGQAQVVPNAQIEVERLMTEQQEKTDAEHRLDSLIGQRCGTCKSWHKRKNYACQHNGPYGGGTTGIEKCKWKPKVLNAP